MADKKNEAPAASEAPVQESTAAPVAVVQQKRNWATPLIAALVVAATLVVGGAGGFALATAVHAGGRPGIEPGQLPGMGQQGGQQGQQGPGQQGGPQQGPGGGQMGPGQGQPPRPDGDDAPAPDQTEEDNTEG